MSPKRKLSFLFLLILLIGKVYAQPVITPVQGPITITLDASGNHTVLLADVVASVTSSVNPNPPTLLVPTSFNCSTLGAQSVTVTATDGAFAGAPTPGNVSFRSPRGISFDANGNLYVSDAGGNKIRMINILTGDVTSVAGLPNGAAGSANGTGTAASFTNPTGTVSDAAGNLYVADANNELIRKIDKNGVVTTFAGTSGVIGRLDGVGIAATFNTPTGLAYDKASGNIYVADMGNNSIRKITSTGIVTTLAGNGNPTFANGTGLLAGFNNPTGLVVDANGNIFVADRGNNRIRMVTSLGVVTTFAGAGIGIDINGTGVNAGFGGPTNIAIDASGNFYVTDFNGNTIRKITPQAQVTTLAGSGAAGAADDIGVNASFNQPWGIAVDAQGNVYVGDSNNNRIRKVSPTGVTTTYAGSANFNSVDGNVGSGAYGNITTVKIPVNVVTIFAFLTTYSNVNITAGAGGTAPIPNYTSIAMATSNCSTSNITFTQSPAAGTSLAAGATQKVTITATDASNNKITASFNVTAISPPVISPVSNNIVLTLDGTGNKTLALADVATVTSAINPNPPVTLNPVAFNCTTLGPQSVTVTATDGSFGTTPTPANVAFRVPRGLTLDPSGNLYVADAGNNKIRKITPTGVVTTFAGSGTAGNTNSTGVNATFNTPSGVTSDGSGNIYVGDALNNLIRKITPAGVVTTVAGSGAAGRTNATGLAASFNQPYGLVGDVFGNLYIADFGNSLIRKITPAGVVTTFAGSGIPGFANGTGTAASFNGPTGLGIDSLNNIYVADRNNNRIRKITPAGVVTTLAGSGFADYSDGTGAAASFKSPYDLTVDGFGNVYVADGNNNDIRKITPAGVVTTFAGGGAPGFADGTGSAATFNNPWGIVVDPANNLYVSDQNNNKIRKVTSASVVTTLAGSGQANNTDGNVGGGAFGNVTTLKIPVTVVNTITITSTYNNVTIPVTGSATSAPLPDYTAKATATDNCVAGAITFTQSPVAGTAVNVNSPVTVTLKATDNTGAVATTSFTVNAITPPVITPKANIIIALDGTGNKTLAIADLGTVTSAYNANPPTKISPATLNCNNIGAQNITVTATDGTFGTALTPAAVSFSSPFGEVFDAAGNLYVSDYNGNIIRKITPAGVVSTYAGTGALGFGNGVAAASSFANPAGLAIDAAGNIYVADNGNNAIRKITPAGVVSTFAGNGTAGAGNGTGGGVSFNGPTGLAIDASGNLYVGDSGNNRVRKITSAGVTSTLAGSGLPAPFSDGPGAMASFNSPAGVAVDAAGNVYVTDEQNHRIRKISPTGNVTTIAGNGGIGSTDGNGNVATFNDPFGIALDASNNVYVVDNNAFKIRKITPANVVSTIAGNGARGAVDGTALAASFNSPNGIAFDASGLAYIADGGNNKIRQITPVGNVITYAGSGTAGAANGSIGVPPSGNVSTLVIPVTVISTPVITSTYNNVTVSTGSGTTATLPNYAATATATDNCVASAITFTQTPAAGTTFAVNTSQSVTLTATDASGSKATVTFTVTAVQPPVITAVSNNIILALDATGNRTILGKDVATATSGINPNPPIQVSPSTVNCTNVGPLTLTVTATDGSFGTPINPSGATFSHPFGIATDNQRNIYITDQGNNKIRKITSAGVVTTLAGSGTQASTDGTGTSASFNVPLGIAVDNTGTVYVSDFVGNKIRKITSAGSVSTFAGNGAFSSNDGTGTAASFNNPAGVVLDASGNLYVADEASARIRKITPAGVVTTLAGGNRGYADGTGAAAMFNNPIGLAIDAQSNIYVADELNNKVRMITPAGVVSTLIDNGTGVAAAFNAPVGITIDGLGNIYVTDQSNRISKVNTARVLSIFAGSGTASGIDGTGASATFNSPYGITVDAGGKIDVADFSNNKIRQITSAAAVSTIAGSGTAGSTDGNVGGGAFGNVSTAQIPVTVISTPVFTSTYSNITIPVGSSGKVVLPDYTASATATDNCTASKITFTQSPAAGFNLPINVAQPVTLTATDASGNKATVTFNVTAISPPVITPKSNALTFTLDATGNKTIALSDIATVTSATNPNPPVQISPSTFSCATVGPQTVTVTATDGTFASGGNPATGNVTTLQIPVTVFSTPVFTSIYSNVTIKAGPSGSASMPDYTATAKATDNCTASAIVFTQSPAAGTNLPINVAQTLTLTATDASGAKATVSFTVTAISPPVITPKSNNIVLTLDATGNRTLSLADIATVTSATNPNPPTQISPATLSCSNLGQQTITVTATDGTFASGSTAATGNVTTLQIPVTVISTPVITSTYSNVTVPVNGTGTASLPDYTLTATATDNCMVSSITFSQSPAAGTPIALGAQVAVTLTATDALGSKASVTFNVTAVQASQIITFQALPQSSYGNGDFSPGATASSGLPVTYTSNNTNIATIVNGKIHSIGAGTTTIVASQAGNVNYSAAPNVIQTLTVLPAALTISADNQSKIAGTPNPTLTASYNGFVNGDTQASLTTQPTLTTTATIASPQGIYAIKASGAFSPNYSISYSNGILTVYPITQVAPVITAKSNNIILPLDPTGNRTLQLSDVATVVTFGGQPVTIQLSPASFNCSTVGLQLVTVTATNTAVSGATSSLVIPVTVTSQPVITSLFTDVSLPVNSSGFATLTDYTSTATASDNCIVNGVTFTQTPAAGTTLALGSSVTITITATDASGGTATASFSATAVKGTQTITLNAFSPVTYGSADFDPAATSTSGLQPTYTSSNTAVATIVAGKIHLTGAGTSVITASQSGDANYNAATPVTQTLTVTPAVLTVTASSQSKVYGSANPAFSVAYSGFVNNDTFISLAAQPTANTAATASSAVGTYAITPAGGVSPNYTFNYVAGTLTITPAALAVTANNQTKIYGAAIPALSVAYNGFVNGDTQASLTMAPAVTTTATQASPVGTYPITPAGAVSPNYTFTYNQGTLTIGQAALLISADNQTKVYGAPNPTLTATYTGFANGDTQVSLTTLPAIVTNATTTSVVGNYAITASGAASPNYNITYANGTLSVTPAVVTVTANNQSKTYGTINPTLTVAYSGFANGDTQTSLTTQPSVTTTAVTSSPVGTYPVTASGAKSTNYTFNYVAGTLTVTPANINVTANNQTKVYGTANPPLTISYAGFANGDTQASLTTMATATTTPITGSVVGTYPITPAGAASQNYTFTYLPGTLTVTPAALNITANNQTKVFGTPNPALTVTYNGFINGDTQASLTAQPVVTTIATTTSALGNYPITVNGASSPNYAITYTQGTLSVTQATITVTANNVSKVYGAVNPALSVTYTGFINGDTQSVITTPATVSTTATTASATGTYPVTPSGAKAANYIFNYVTGTLTVTPAVLTVTANNQNRPYGVPNQGLTVSYSGFVNGDSPASLTTQATATTVATTASSVGMYPIIPTGAASPNYTFVYTNGVFTITPVGLLITANNQVKPYGAPVPPLTVVYSGFISGDSPASLTTQPTVTTTATVASGVGTYPIIASGAVSPNYTITYANGTLAVARAVLNVTANNQTRVYSAANPALTVSYTGFVNGDTQAAVATQPTVTTTANALSPTGVYPILANGAAAANYTFNYIPGALTVTRATLVVTADNLTKVFGAVNPPLTASYTGFVNGETAANLTSLPLLTTTAVTASPIGTYSITPSGGSSPNYTLTYVAGTLRVLPTGLTITANNQTKVYGSANPAFTLTYSGFINGDTPASLTTPATVISTATTTSGVGNYGITVGGATSSNYSITFVNGTLGVTPALLSVTANNQSKNYGSANPPLTLTYSGFKNTDTQAALTTQPTVTTTATMASGAGTYPITASGANAANYTFAYTAGTLTVNPVLLTITANNQSRGYGSPDSVFTVTYSGFVNGDNVASLTTQPIVTSTATVTSVQGAYPITAQSATSPNYTFKYVPGVLTITPAQIAFSPLTPQTYGAPDFSPGATSPVPITYTSSNTAVATIVAGNVHIIGAGTTVITANNGSTTVSQTLVINKAPLSIVADNIIRAYNNITTLLTFTATYTGFVYNETPAALITQPNFVSTGNAGSIPGTYPITVSGAVSNNYAITYTGGTLTIIQAQSLFTFNTLPTKTYLDADFAPGATNVSGDAITYTSSNTAVATIVNGLIHLVAPGTSTITAIIASNPNYISSQPISQLLTVNKASQSINIANLGVLVKGNPLSINIAATSGLPVTVTSSDSYVVSITNTAGAAFVLNPLHLGTTVITASQPGNAFFLPASTIVQTVNVQDNNNDLVLVRPAVSPNGDGINDVLYIEGIKNYPDNRLTLININGVKIYQASGYDNQNVVFDGHSNISGAFQPQGTYFYLLEYKVNGQSVKKTGYIILKY